MKLTDEEVEQIIRDWSENDRWPDGFTVTYIEDCEALLRRIDALSTELKDVEDQLGVALAHAIDAAQERDVLKAQQCICQTVKDFYRDENDS